MPNFSPSDIFSFTWKVENIHLSNRKMNTYISTPTFQVGALQNTAWKFRLAPAGIDDPLYMGCSLTRTTSEREQDEPLILKLRFNVSVLAEGGISRFEKCVDTILRRQEFEDVPRFIRKSELLPTDTPQNNLIIFCQIINDSIFNSAQDLNYDLEALSSDLTGLLESGFRSDFKMYCRGEIFNIHKFILISRWPDFCQAFEIEPDISARHDIIMTGIEASTLKAFLTFLYSGKLKRKDISMELCTYMHEQYCDNLMASLDTPTSNLEFVTHMHHEWKYLVWEVGDDNAWKKSGTPFFRVIPMEEVYPSEMVIIFDFKKRNGEEWLELTVEFTGFTDLNPLILDGEISFLNKNAIVCTRKFNYLMETREEWCFPWLVKKSDLFPNERNSKSIEINMCVCDGTSHTRQVSASVNNASSFREVKDLRKLLNDLITSTYKKDLKLKIGQRLYDVHSPVFAARSAKFREMIVHTDGIIEIKENMSKEASDSFISYLYGGKIGNLNVASLNSLNKVAKKYSLISLEKKTRRMLEE